MNNEAEKYLQEVNNGLSNVPKQDREDILLEIKNHIYEATQKGDAVDQVIYRLGPPIKLAKAYSFGYNVEHKKLKISDVLNSFAFYGLAGLSGIFVVPALSIMAITFLMCSVFLPGLAITNFIGITNIPMLVFGDNSIPPGILQLALSILIGVLFIWLTLLCWRGLKKYIKKVSEKYRKLKLDK